MKQYLILLVLPIIFSCKKTEEAPQFEQNTYFESPQPINDSELNKFPSKFRGLYVNKDSTYLRIGENVILTESYFRFRIHKKEIDSLKKEFDISDDKLIQKKTKQVYDFLNKGDSLEIIDKNTDTIFRLSNSQKAKRINGQLVLSTKDSIFWTVKLFSLEKNTLRIRYIYSKEDLKRMDSITKIKSATIDSMSFIVKPTRREFKKILNLKHFGYENQYNKILKL